MKLLVYKRDGANKIEWAAIFVPDGEEPDTDWLFGYSKVKEIDIKDDDLPTHNPFKAVYSEIKK